MTLTTVSITELVEELLAEIAPDDAALYRPRFNVAPSDLHWILQPGLDRRVLVPAVWGYLRSSRVLVNVRGESLASGSGFRDALQSRRCVVVSDGFFEWNQQKAPFWYRRADRGLVLLAGICQPAKVEPTGSHPDGVPHSPRGGEAQGVARPRFTVLTTRPNDLVAEVHDRMPVVLEPDQLDDWLAGEPSLAARLIAPAAEDRLTVTPLSRRVNSVKNDDPECLEPLGSSTPRQTSLF